MRRTVGRTRRGWPPTGGHRWWGSSGPPAATWAGSGASGITAVTLSVSLVPGRARTRLVLLLLPRRGPPTRSPRPPAAGLEVVLDPGLQYSPDVGLPTAGRHPLRQPVRRPFSGAPGSGDDVANAVTDPSVRHAQAVYLAWLGAHLPDPHPGRRPRGRRSPGRAPLSRPATTTGMPAPTGPTTQQQADLPAGLRGWIPGTGTPSEAQTFLDAYDARMIGYGRWFDAELYADFSTDELLLLPGVGRTARRGAD